MSDRSTHGDEPRETGPVPHSDSRPEVEPDLTDLQARLDELQQSVEMLGTQGYWEQGQPQHEPPLDLGPEPFSGPPTGPYSEPFYSQTPAGGYPTEFETPSPPRFPPPPEYPPADPALTQPAPPAATNGHGESDAEASEVSARWATVAIVEAGPFANLIELRHFEDDLASLAAVSDVHVRRFGHGRATIEVGLTGPYPLARQLYQLNRPMELSDGPDGEVLIELARPAEPEPDERTTPPQPVEPS